MLELLDLPNVLAGHGYDVGGSAAPNAGGGDGDDGGGIGTASILAAAAVALVTAGVLVSMASTDTRARLLRAAPKVAMLVLVATPLAVWTASAGSGRETLFVERSTALTGAPELLVSLADPKLNTRDAARGATTVQIECVGRDGRVTVRGEHRWPFETERGYDYPHAHQLAGAEQVRRADRCRVLGTRTPLEAEVQGALR